VQAEMLYRVVRSHDSHASCEQHVLRTTNVPPSVIMLYPPWDAQTGPCEPTASANKMMGLRPLSRRFDHAVAGRRVNGQDPGGRMT
jgi:hypothetical protein